MRKTYIQLDVPMDFIWVLKLHKEWQKQNKYGNIKLIYKSGNICGVEKLTVEKPPVEKLPKNETY